MLALRFICQRQQLPADVRVLEAEHIHIPSTEGQKIYIAIPDDTLIQNGVSLLQVLVQNYLRTGRLQRDDDCGNLCRTCIVVTGVYRDRCATGYGALQKRQQPPDTPLLQIGADDHNALRRVG